MSHYVHHVPGRLRLRSSEFKCNAEKVRLLENRLRETEGVWEVRFNSRNGSLTVRYDRGSAAGEQIVAMLSGAGCAPASKRQPDISDQEVMKTFRRAVIGALVQQTVNRSFNTLALLLR